MSIWNVIILSGVAGAALVSWGQPRFLAWIFAVLASYIVSVFYWDMGGPQPEFFAGVCDMVVVALITRKALYYWELWVGLMFLVMGFANWLYLADGLAGSNLISPDLYSSILEVANVSAIVLMGGAASFYKSGMRDGLAFRPWLHVFGRVRHVYARAGTRD